jgi:hypothetical protein
MLWALLKATIKSLHSGLSQKRDLGVHLPLHTSTYLHHLLLQFISLRMFHPLYLPLFLRGFQALSLLELPTN